jgi:acyl-CoA synthetase (AMP-forming)/AMP-acid ligase II
VLDRAVDRWPTNEAIVTDSATVTYQELAERVQRLAGGLARAGIRPGDRIAGCLPNGIDIVLAYYAAARVGAVWVGINRALAPVEKARLLVDTSPRLLVGTSQVLVPLPQHTADLDVELVAVDAGDQWARLASGRPVPLQAVDPSGPASIAFTSGTSGTPKGVMHSQHNLALAAEVLAASRGYDSSLRRGDYLPLTIPNLLVLSILTAAQVGGASVLHEGTSAASIASWIRRHRVTAFSGVPTTFLDLARTPSISSGDLGSLRDVFSGGTALPTETGDRFLQKFGLPVQNSYGLTEAPAVVTLDNPREPSPPGASGRPLPHLELSFSPLSGHRDGGEIVVGAATEGPWANMWRPMLGYWNRPEAKLPVVEGRLHTGDVGCLDEAGRVRVTDRLTSVIVRGGANVYPAEVERVLRRVPGVAEAVVVGMPHDRLGESVNAVVELETATATSVGELLDACRSELADYKVPATILIVDAIQRNALGKPEKRAAQARLASEGR